MGLPRKAETLLRELLAGVRVEDDRYSGALHNEAIAVYGRPGGTVAFSEEDFPKLQALTDELARAALGSGGPHESSVRSLVVEACFRAREETVERALEVFENELQRGPRTWVIGEPVAAVYAGDELAVGQCRVVADLEAAGAWASRMTEDKFPAGVLVTDVSAYDRESAYAIAREKFEEGRSVLSFIDGGHEQICGEGYVFVRDGRYQGYQSPRSGAFLIQSGDGRNKTDWPGNRHLNAACAKDETDRTDWERRTVAATRWLYRARTASSQSARATHLVTALEAIMAQERSRRYRQIRDRLERSLGVRLRGLDSAAMADWIDQRTAERHQVLHHSMSVGDETEVQRLHQVANHAVGWAAQHLDPFHADGPCQTFDQAHGCGGSSR